MKIIQKKLMLLGMSGALGATIWMTVASALAGSKVEKDVYMNDTDKYVIGQLGTIRASSSVNSFISLDVLSWYGTTVVTATAHSAGSSIRTCTTQNDPDLVAVAASANSDSYVDFGWNDDGTCRYIRIINGSQYRPKAL
jgi:hypothetical protein